MRNWKPDLPYNALPPLPPQQDIETHRILKACILARASLAQIKEGSYLLPNPEILINTIPLLEAQASSKIENIVTTTDKLFLYAENQENADPATKEALRYRTALKEGFNSLDKRPLGTQTAVQICRIIKGVEIDIRKIPGTQLINDKTKKAIYTPPEGEVLLRDFLFNLETFIHQNPHIDPLIRMAVMHYQFEAIHPFTDGNGRTGRILNLLYLIQEGLLELPILYLSRYIIMNKEMYYQYLLEVTTQHSWENWICYMLKSVEETANWTINHVKAIRSLMKETTESIRKNSPQTYSKELVESIFLQPYCRIGHLVARGLWHRQTISQYLKRLCEIGILREMKFGREKLFINTKLMDLLTNATGLK